MREVMIEARELTKQYRNVIALNHADITVRRGDIYGLVGDNGAGKTTFLKLVTGQIYPTGGYLRLFGGHDEKALRRGRTRTGALVESPAYYPKMSVEKNLEYYRIQRGIPGKDHVKKALQMVDLWEERNTKCEKLSLGMKQRYGIALALLGEPELLILDEPINGLDPSGIIEIRNLLLKLNREKGITVIISSHILSELEQIATVYGFLGGGYVLEEIEAEKLHESCADFVELKLQEPEKYAAILEKDLNCTEYQVLQDKTIRIRNPKLEIEQYSRLASANGIGILGMERQQMSLEEYYMNLKNRGRLSC